MLQRAPNAIPINRQIKIIFLLSFLAAIVSIHYFHSNLLLQNGQPESDGHLQPQPEQINHPEQQSVSKELKNITTTTTPTSNSSSTTSPNSKFNDKCFKARNNTIHPSNYGNLKPPYINLGFPKMGTTSLHSFFACAGYRSMHFGCKIHRILSTTHDVAATNNIGITTCAGCIQKSVEQQQEGAHKGRHAHPFAKCGRADAYTQLDNGSWGNFPQIEYLDEILRAHPNGTFLLTFRTIEKWYHSITHWPPENVGTPRHQMSDGLRHADITGFPRGTGKNAEEFGRWFCAHVTRVREAVARNPMQTLVEIDIEDPMVGTYMANVFDVEEGCWGHVNVNARLHPDVNQSKVDIPWLAHGKLCIKGKTKMRMRKTEPLPPLPPGMSHLVLRNYTCDDA